MRRAKGLARGAAALLLAGGCGGGSAPAPPDHPNVILFVIDTLRADQMSLYGCADNTTPNLDAFARENLWFEHAYAPAPQTAPSHASLFTSTYPSSHGVWNEVPLQNGPNAHPKLPDAAVTVAEVFRDHGYRTAAIADGGWIQASRGFDQGFDLFQSKTVGVVDRVQAAMDWLDQAREDQPFFLFLHTYQVHAPYLPPPGYEERFARGYQGPLRQVLADARAYVESGQVQNPITDVQDKFFKPALKNLTPADQDFLRALYQAELSLVDEQFALLMGYLRLHGLLEHTIVVVTADHGEEFGEHGDYTHNQVYDECLHVPLLAHVPDGPRGLRRSDPLDLVDLAPTLLAAAGLPAPPSAQGRALDLRAAVPPELKDFVAEINFPRPQIAFREGDWKAVLHLDAPLGVDGSIEVFDLSSDPDERHPLPDSDPRAQRARAAVRAWRESTAEVRSRYGLQPEVPRAEDMSAEQARELAELGYAGSEPP